MGAESETSPGRVPDPSLVDTVLTAGRAMVAIAVRSVEAAPVEVTVIQHRVLVLLAARDVLKINELADLLGINQSNASRHCANLEDSGLVTRRRSDTDGRAVEVRLTAAGRGVLEAVDEARRRELTQLLARLPADLLGTADTVFTAFNRAAGELASVEVPPR
ncbi:MarR family transcriptional regulator [Nocardioides sp. KR10-350]|uniref:MarR family winged helix-turn-helix transcriptional regulator n=1 Tax=Nocardioides cheoyonin TaxID=3156615 RepID=UPI0032B3DFFE